MITINPIKLNTPKTVTFGESTLNNMTKRDGILLFANPSALSSFEKNDKLAHEADVVEQDRLWKIPVSVGKKFVRAFSVSKPNVEQSSSYNAIANHMYYMA